MITILNRPWINEWINKWLPASNKAGKILWIWKNVFKISDAEQMTCYIRIRFCDAHTINRDGYNYSRTCLTFKPFPFELIYNSFHVHSIHLQRHISLYAFPQFLCIRFSDTIVIVPRLSNVFFKCMHACLIWHIVKFVNKRAPLIKIGHCILLQLLGMKCWRRSYWSYDSHLPSHNTTHHLNLIRNDCIHVHMYYWLIFLSYLFFLLCLLCNVLKATR